MLTWHFDRVFTSCFYNIMALLLFLMVIGAEKVLFAGAIHVSALRGDVEEIKNCIAVGEDVDTQDKKGWTPLHHAAAAGQNKAVDFLLDKRASIDSRDSERETPLHKASHWGRDSIVKHLLNRGASVNAQNNYGQTPLHQAGNTQVVRSLIKNGADIQSCDYHGKTALHSASMYGKEDIVRELVKAGADILAHDLRGKRPFDLAGSKSKDKQKAKRIQLYLKEQERLAKQLQNAVEVGNVERIAKVLKAGASVNLPDQEGNTPLHLAIQNNNIAAVKYLLDVPGIRMRIQNNEGNIPIEDAADKPEIIDLFKQKFKDKST